MMDEEQFERDLNEMCFLGKYDFMEEENENKRIKRQCKNITEL